MAEEFKWMAIGLAICVSSVAFAGAVSEYSSAQVDIAKAKCNCQSTIDTENKGDK